MTLRQRHRNEILWAVRQWMRCHGVWLVLLLAFSSTMPKAALAAEDKLDSFGDLLKTLQKEKDAKKITETKSILTDKPAAVAPKTQVKKKENKKDEVVVEKTVKGAVAFIRKNRMAVELPSTEEGGEELFLALDKGVKVKKAKTFSEIAQGDEVTVKYLETSKKPKTNDEEPFVLSRVASEITLTKKLKLAESSLLESRGALSE